MSSIKDRNGIGDVVDKMYNQGKSGEREKEMTGYLAVEALFPGLSISQKKELNISFQPKTHRNVFRKK